MAGNAPTLNLAIKLSNSLEEMHHCAQLMVASDPWLTLGIGFEKAIHIVNSNNIERYIATIDEEIVGFLLLNMAGAFKGYIEDICVAEKWRNQGIGSKLLDHAEQRVLKEIPNVFLCVSSFNDRAQALYRRRGYKLVGELKNYIVQGYSEFFMRKTVGPVLTFEKLT